MKNDTIEKKRGLNKTWKKERDKSNCWTLIHYNALRNYYYLAFSVYFHNWNTRRVSSCKVRPKWMKRQSLSKTGKRQMMRDTMCVIYVCLTMPIYASTDNTHTHTNIVSYQFIWLLIFFFIFQDHCATYDFT